MAPPFPSLHKATAPDASAANDAVTEGSDLEDFDIKTSSHIRTACVGRDPSRVKEVDVSAMPKDLPDVHTQKHAWNKFCSYYSDLISEKFEKRQCRLLRDLPLPSKVVILEMPKEDATIPMRLLREEWGDVEHLAIGWDSMEKFQKLKGKYLEKTPLLSWARNPRASKERWDAQRSKDSQAGGG